jgi:hypothetical protein
MGLRDHGTMGPQGGRACAAAPPHIWERAAARPYRGHTPNSKLQPTCNLQLSTCNRLGERRTMGLQDHGTVGRALLRRPYLGTSGSSSLPGGNSKLQIPTNLQPATRQGPQDRRTTGHRDIGTFALWAGPRSAGIQPACSRPASRIAPAGMPALPGATRDRRPAEIAAGAPPGLMLQAPAPRGRPGGKRKKYLWHSIAACALPALWARNETL